MAEYLASIFGTEKDKVNCSFYFKIGACRHGDRCSRIHNKPTFSQTCLLQNLYVNPQNSAKSADGSHLVANVSDEEMQEHYDNFFEDVFVECEDKYGEIEEMNVCDNLGDHLVGNVYIKMRKNILQHVIMSFKTTVSNLKKHLMKRHPTVQLIHENEDTTNGDPLNDNIPVPKESTSMIEVVPANLTTTPSQFRKEEDAERAVNDLNNRWFGGRPVYAELSPVTDFREACCRQYEMGECTRSGFCNFMHLKPISRELRRYLYSRRKGGRAPPKARSRSRSPRRARSRSRGRANSRSPGRRSGRSGRY